MLKRADWQALQEAQKGAKPIQLTFSFFVRPKYRQVKGGKRAHAPKRA
jgi:hypothetical protein